MLKEKAVIASLLVLALSAVQTHAETIDVRLRISNRASDEKVITRTNLITIKKFILKKGLRETYCSMYNNNPAYHTKNFSFYLNPDSGQENINCETDKSDFHSLTIRNPNRKNQYRRVEFLDKDYVYIVVSRPTKDLSVSQAREFVIKAATEILEEIKKANEEILDISRLAITNVTASSVNGDRPLTNEYYGVLNLFDNGTNIINEIRYDYWLSDRDSQHWINFSFDIPVSINSVIVETTGQHSPEEFALEFNQISDNSKTTKKYIESVPTKGLRTKYDLKTPITNISEVKITFPGPDVIEISEIRILGSVTSDVDVALKGPKIGLSKVVEKTIKATRIRIKNASAFDYELVLVGKEFFGDLKSGETTEYRIFERAYKYNSIRLAVKGQVFRLTPTDYVGETPLGEGYFTYNIDVQDFSKKVLSIKAVKDK